MTISSRASSFLCLLLMVCGASPAGAVVLYEENFTNAGVNASGRWRAYNTISVGGTAYGGSGATKGVGTPLGSSEVNDLDIYGYVQNAPGSTTTVDYFIHTTASTDAPKFTAPAVPESYSILQASWYQNTGGSVSSMSYSFAVQVEDVWYASGTSFTGGSPGTLRTLDLLASSWYEIDFELGGAQASLDLDKSGTAVVYEDLFGEGESITGYGYYINDLAGSSGSTSYNTVRFDTLTVNGTAVPEPGRAVLMVVALGTVALRRRRLIRSQ